MKHSGVRRARAALAVGISLAGVLACAPAGQAAVREGHQPAPNHKIGHSTSSNWSGYDVTGGRYTSVSASWTQPAVNCSKTPTGWSSFWVGLDGDRSSTVEQTGTEADCSNGVPRYSSWYEMYPKFPKTYSDPVGYGDHFTASVTTAGNGSFTLKIADTTRGWSHSTTQKLRSAKLASAEVIAEAPSSSGGVLPLADFGTVGFSGATVNGSALTSSTPGLDPITMQSSNGTVKAKPSSISNGSFSITWSHS
jgi:Peptidase A4 family